MDASFIDSLKFIYLTNLLIKIVPVILFCILLIVLIIYFIKKMRK